MGCGVATKLSLAEIRGNAGRFARRWSDASRENADTQLFWAEFFAAFGIDARRFVVFEHHANRFSTGRSGRIDVFWPGELLIEQKSRGADLRKAADQAYDYLDSLDDKDLPKLIVLCDFNKFVVHDVSVTPKVTHEFDLKSLPNRIGLFTWMAGYTREPAVAVSEQAANAEAVAKMAQLYDALAVDKLSDHHVSVFLTRILFLLFGEDTGLLERGLFRSIIDDKTAADGSDLGAWIQDIFQTLDTAPANRSSRTDEMLLRLPYVNGSIFTEVIPTAHFDKTMRQALLSACKFEWARISPAIFGSMFQAVKSKEARRALGEHYTTERDILRAIGPLFLDQLHSEFRAAQFSVKNLNALWDKISSYKFLDPACGCGNFLVVTYRELRALELRIIEQLQQLQAGGGQTVLLGEDMGLKVSLAQMHGIEIEEWPARIAEVALFIADHQANRHMMETVGSAPDRLPLTISAKIVRENALGLDWNLVLPAADDVVVVGNPPFIGISLRTDQQTAELKAVWGKKHYHGSLDYVSGWYIKAANYMGTHRGRIAFVSTSSICQGEQVAPLWGPILGRGFQIDFAHRTFSWTSEASGKASVHVVIVAFSHGGVVGRKILFDYPNIKGEPTVREVSNISPYLVEGPSVVVHPQSKPLSPALGEVRYGSKPTDGGGFFIGPEEYSQFMGDPAAAKYVRPFVGTKELLHDIPRWCLWMVNLDPSDLRNSALLRERLERVKAFRLASDAASTREYATMARLFRQIAQPETNYLCIPRHVLERRLFFTAKRLGPEIISGDANFVADDPDGFMFAVISSTAYVVWQKTVGGRIKSDLRFSKLGVWNTLPLPSVSSELRKEIVAAGEAVQAARANHPSLSLAQMYDPDAMPLDLIRAHASLDKAVDRAFFGRKSVQSDERRLTLLFELYKDLAAAQKAAA